MPKSEIAPVSHKQGAGRYTGHLFLRHFPRTTKKAFKVACTEKDVFMRDALIILMRRFVYAVREGRTSISIEKLRKAETEDIAE